MSIEDAASLIVAMKVMMSSSSELLTSDGYTAAAEAALQELGWSYPLAEDKKIYWAIRRGVRHGLYILWIASAQKFKFKQVNLQHRFDHYERLIKEADASFEKAMSSDVALFAGVSTYKLFGTKIDAGFAYDSLGRDITYFPDNYVNFAPLEG